MECFGIGTNGKKQINTKDMIIKFLRIRTFIFQSISIFLLITLIKFNQFSIIWFNFSLSHKNNDFNCISFRSTTTVTIWIKCVWDISCISRSRASAKRLRSLSFSCCWVAIKNTSHKHIHTRFVLQVFHECKNFHAHNFFIAHQIT